jgi:hypothetical protein
MQYGSRQQFDTANVGNTRMSTSPLSGGGFSGGGGGIITVLEPFGEYLTDQIDTQRVDPFLEMVSNAAYQEFGIQPDQGGGGGFFSGDFYKNTGGFDPLPEPLPAVQQPVMNPNSPSSPVASISNFGPNVGNGGLFGGEKPVKTATPAVLPEYAKFAGEPLNINDGRYILSGPPDANALRSEPMPIMGGYTGQPMQLPYDPTPMSPLIMDSFAAAGGTLPDFSGSAQSYFNPGDGGQTAYGPIPLSPDRLVQIAQGQLATRVTKPPEVQAYLDHIVKTGGNPTMMAPPPQMNNTNLAGNLLSAGGNLAAFNLGTNPPPQPLTPASGNLVDVYGNPASFSPAQLQEMLAATPISSFQQGPDLSRPAPVPAALVQNPMASGTTISPTGQLLHFGQAR